MLSFWSLTQSHFESSLSATTNNSGFNIMHLWCWRHFTKVLFFNSLNQVLITVYHRVWCQSTNFKRADNSCKNSPPRTKTVLAYCSWTNVTVGSDQFRRMAPNHNGPSATVGRWRDWEQRVENPHSGKLRLQHSTDVLIFMAVCFAF